MLTSETVEKLRDFVAYAQGLEGDEKGEAQVFCDRLFRAFGHEGYKEAGATLEYRVRKKGKGTKFADLLWRPRLLIEMKKRGEKLERHYSQPFDYWLQLVPQRPRYVVLCNFDEFWVYDFDTQLEDPVDKIPLEDLPDRYTALNFMFADDREPQFGNNRVAVTRAAADKVARVFNSTVARGEDRNVAQRCVLQCVVALFSEDFGLLPSGLFTGLVEECRRGASTYHPPSSGASGHSYRRTRSRIHWIVAAGTSIVKGSGVIILEPSPRSAAASPGRRPEHYGPLQVASGCGSRLA